MGLSGVEVGGIVIGKLSGVSNALSLLQISIVTLFSGSAGCLHCRKDRWDAARAWQH